MIRLSVTDNPSAKVAGCRSDTGSVFATHNGKTWDHSKSTTGSMSSETIALVQILITMPVLMLVRQFGIISECREWMFATGSLLVHSKFRTGHGRSMAITTRWHVSGSNPGFQLQKNSVFKKRIGTDCIWTKKPLLL